MDKIGTILINREQVQKMLGGLSKSAFFKLVKKWKEAGTPFPEPVKGMPALKRGDLFTVIRTLFHFVNLWASCNNQPVYSSPRFAPSHNHTDHI